MSSREKSSLPPDFLVKGLSYMEAFKANPMQLIERNDVNPVYLDAKAKSAFEAIRADKPTTLLLAELAGLRREQINRTFNREEESLTEAEIEQYLQLMKNNPGTVPDFGDNTPMYRWKGEVVVAMKNGTKWKAVDDGAGSLLYTRLDEAGQPTQDYVKINVRNEVFEEGQGNVIRPKFGM